MASEDDIVKMTSKSFEELTRSARASASEVSRLRDALKKARDSGIDVGKNLTAAVELYAKALKNGDKNADQLRNTILAFKEAAPEAFYRATGAAEAWFSATKRGYADSVTGSGELAERIRDVINGYQKLHNVTRADAVKSLSSRLGTEGVHAIYSMEGKLEAIKQDRTAARAARIEGLDTLAISQRIAKARVEGKVVEKRLTEQNNQASEAGMKRLAAEARAATAGGGLKDMASMPGAIGAAVDKMSAIKSGTAFGGIGKAMRGIMMSETAAAGGVAPGAMAGGISMAIGSLAKTLGPLSASLTGAALVGKIILGVFQGFGDSMRVAAGQSRALAMTSNRSFSLLNADMIASKSNIISFARVSGGMGIMAREAFEKNVIPAAQEAMMTFGTLDRTTIDSADRWAGALSNVAVQGHGMGLSYERSIGMATRATMAFGGAHSDVEAKFKKWAVGAKLAALTVEQLEESLGGLTEWGKRFGKSGDTGFMEDFGARLRLAGIESTQQRMMYGGAVSSLAMDMPRLLAFTATKSGTGGAINSWMNAARSGPNAMMNMSYEAMRNLITGPAMKIGGKSPFDAIMKGTNKEAFAAAVGLGQQLGISPEALANKTQFMQLNTLLSGATTEKGKEQLDRMKAEMSGDWTQAGMKSIVNQEGILTSMVGAINRIGNMLETAMHQPLYKTMTSGVDFGSQDLSVTPPSGKDMFRR